MELIHRWKRLWNVCRLLCLVLCEARLALGDSTYFGRFRATARRQHKQATAHTIGSSHQVGNGKHVKLRVELVPAGLIHRWLDVEHTVGQGRGPSCSGPDDHWWPSSTSYVGCEGMLVRVVGRSEPGLPESQRTRTELPFKAGREREREREAERDEMR